MRNIILLCFLILGFYGCAFTKYNNNYMDLKLSYLLGRYHQKMEDDKTKIIDLEKVARDFDKIMGDR